MRVYVEHDMTVNHNTNVVTLKGGEIVEGPLAVYLVESNCDVTIEQDDRPAADPAPEQPSQDGEKQAAGTDPNPTPEGGATPDQESHTPGAESPEAGQESTEQPEAVEPAAETGAAE